MGRGAWPVRPPWRHPPRASVCACVRRPHRIPYCGARVDTPAEPVGTAASEQQGGEVARSPVLCCIDRVRFRLVAFFVGHRVTDFCVLTMHASRIRQHLHTLEHTAATHDTIIFRELCGHPGGGMAVGRALIIERRAAV